MPEDDLRQDFAAELFLPVPYQMAFIEQLVTAVPPARFLLTAPPGSGKTVALVAAAKALKAKRGTLRCLSIAPAPLALMWQEQLLRFGGLETVAMAPQTYRRLQAESGTGVNVWSKVSSAVASIDFLKAAGRMDEVLGAGWDLVLLDEAHRSTNSTQRGEVSRDIWNASNVAIAVATIQLSNHPAWLAEDARTTKVHWKLADLIGRKVMPERRIHTTPTHHRILSARLLAIFRIYSAKPRRTGRRDSQSAYCHAA